MTAQPLTVPESGTDVSGPTLHALYGDHFARLRALLRGEAAPMDALVDGPTPLDRLTDLFGLSPFERDVLLLCLGAEIDLGLMECVAEASRDPSGLPSFGLALSRLPDAHWDAASPSRPLRAWQLISMDAGPRLTAARLALDEAVLLYLTGVDATDPALHGVAVSDPPRPLPLPASHQRIVADAATLLAAGQHVCLMGAGTADRRLIAESVAAAAGNRVLRVAEPNLPTTPHQRAAVHRRLARAALLDQSLMLIEVAHGDPSARDRAAELADELLLPTVVSGIDVAAAHVTTLRLRLPERNEQHDLWTAALGRCYDDADGQLPALSSTFRVGVPFAATVAADVACADAAARPAVLWESTRNRLRRDLEALADRIPAAASWDDLVLPADCTALLAELVRHARSRSTVEQHWPGTRGQGVSALFTGDSGTGKTMAAEVIAAELGLDLYRIDLARMVDKYIGETEKNLSRVFDAAEASGAVLLFDEADALFGKRGEVKDAHDRYANLEVAHLLARMESYDGVAILTTNLSGTIDRAFVRRLRFIVPFPFPDVSTRRRLWQRAFPATVAADLDLDRLAQLPIAGGTIRSIAVGAVVAAAETSAPVTLSQVLAVARRELVKSGKNPGIAAMGADR